MFLDFLASNLKFSISYFNVILHYFTKKDLDDD